MLKKEAVRQKMAKLRAMRKPPKLANVHHTVKSLPESNTLSYANVKNWIKTQESIVKTARITERSRNGDSITKRQRQGNENSNGCSVLYSFYQKLYYYRRLV